MEFLNNKKKIIKFITTVTYTSLHEAEGLI